MDKRHFSTLWLGFLPLQMQYGVGLLIFIPQVSTSHSRFRLQLPIRFWPEAELPLPTQPCPQPYSVHLLPTVLKALSLSPAPLRSHSGLLQVPRPLQLRSPSSCVFSPTSPISLSHKPLPPNFPLVAASDFQCHEIKHLRQGEETGPAVGRFVPSLSTANPLSRYVCMSGRSVVCLSPCTVSLLTAFRSDKSPSICPLP